MTRSFQQDIYAGQAFLHLLQLFIHNLVGDLVHIRPRSCSSGFIALSCQDVDMHRDNGGSGGDDGDGDDDGSGDDGMVKYVSHMWLSYALYSKPNPATGRARNFPCDDLMNTLFLVLHRHQVIPSPSSSSLISISMTFLHYDIVCQNYNISYADTTGTDDTMSKTAMCDADDCMCW